MTIPKRGEIWTVNFNPGRGSGQKGIRPALVIQNDIGNEYSSTTIVAALTTTRKKYPITVVIGRGEGGLKENSTINLSQILTVDKSRLLRKVGHIGRNRITEVDAALKVSLGLASP